MIQGKEAEAETGTGRRKSVTCSSFWSGRDKAGTLGGPREVRQGRGEGVEREDRDEREDREQREKREWRKREERWERGER